jgi:low temperature requirement protein LtrA
VLLWFAVSAVPSIVGAIVSSPTRVALWILALAIDYTGTILFYPAPWTGPMRLQWPVVPEHSAERYRQFFIIALGELVLIAGTTYGGNYFGYGGRTAAFVVSFISTVLLWQIYTHRTGDMLPGAIATASDPYRVIRRALDPHLLMVVGILSISAGYELVIQHPFRAHRPGLANRHARWTCAVHRRPCPIRTCGLCPGLLGSGDRAARVGRARTGDAFRCTAGGRHHGHGSPVGHRHHRGSP